VEGTACRGLVLENGGGGEFSRNGQKGTYKRDQPCRGVGKNLGTEREDSSMRGKGFRRVTWGSIGNNILL